MGKTVIGLIAKGDQTKSKWLVQNQKQNKSVENLDLQLFLLPQ